MVLGLTLFQMIKVHRAWGFDYPTPWIWMWSNQSLIKDRRVTVISKQWWSTMMMIIVTDTEGVTNLPHYKNYRPENLSDRGEKIRVFFTKTLFAFPSGLILKMIWTLNFEELGCLVAGLTFRLIKNAARMFLISQVLLQLNHIMFHFSNRVLEAASELRHVEYIVDLGEVQR